MEYKQREYALFSACGLNCGLCPRYHTDGASKCPGCAGEGFSKKHPTCGVLSCCQRKHFDYCCECAEFSCKKYDGADETDSFITHRNQFSDFAKAKNLGVESYQAELNGKVAILEKLLAEYDDGRHKSFYCIAVNLLKLSDIQTIMLQLGRQAKPLSSAKEKAVLAAQLFQEAANKEGIDLKLRKKGSRL